MPSVAFSARRLSRARTGAALAAASALAAATVIFVGGCEAEKKVEKPVDPEWKLPEGEHGLRKLSREDYPDLTAAWGGRDDKFARALDYSATWFGTGTSRANYSSEQMGPLSRVLTGGHDQAAASVIAVLPDTAMTMRSGTASVGETCAPCADASVMDTVPAARSVGTSTLDTATLTVRGASVRSVSRPCEINESRSSAVPRSTTVLADTRASSVAVATDTVDPAAGAAAASSPPAVVLTTSSSSACAPNVSRSVPSCKGVTAPLATCTEAGSTSPGLATGSDTPMVRTTLERAAPDCSDMSRLPLPGAIPPTACAPT